MHSTAVEKVLAHCTVDMDDPFFVRNLVYGVEDSLISTTGVVAGIALAGLQHKDIITTGSILVLVEALSMAFGAFVSEDSFMKTAKMKHGVTDVLTYAGVMFVAYLLAGLVPMIPFLLHLDGAWKYSIAFAIASLFALVMLVQKDLEKATTLTAIGGVILGVSIAAGRFMKS